MNWIENVPMAFFQWVMSTSGAACLIVGLIVIGKKALGDRLPPRWHYILWLALVVKLILPWTLESPLSMWNLVPERTLSAVHATFEISSRLTLVESAGPNATRLVFFFVWLSGLLGMAFQTFAANRRFARRLRKQTFINDPAILRMFEECKELMSIRRNIGLMESDLVSGPALFGFLRPCLIIPNLTVIALRPDQLRYIFLHELAHVRRNDIAANWVMRILLAVHWFNPFLWYAYYRMRQDQEVACDALVLSRVRPDETKAYGHTLIELFEKTSAPVRIAGIASLSGNMSQIKRRIVMIQLFRQSSGRRSLIGTVVLITLCLFALTAGRTTVQASLALPSPDDSYLDERIMLFSTFDEQGVEERRRLLVIKENEEWKINFVTEARKTDPTMAGVSGKLTIPESGYYSRPGTRDLIFQKGPFDDEWKLISIEEGQFAAKR